MLFEEIYELMALEMAVKEIEVLKHYYPNDNSNTFRKTFVEKSIEFCQKNDLCLLFDDITKGVNNKNIHELIVIVDYLQGLPLSLPPTFVKMAIKLPQEKLKNQYPNFYVICDAEYLLKMKAILLKQMRTSMIYKKIK